MPKKSKKVELQQKLMAAVSEGNLANIKLCLDEGADAYADVNGEYGTSLAPMCLAINAQQNETAIYLFDMVGLSPSDLLVAVENKNYSLAKIFLEKGLIHLPKNVIDKPWVQSILKSIEGIDDKDCSAIRSIFSLEKLHVREKIGEIVKNGDYLLTDSEEELIKANPYLLHELTAISTKGMSNTPLLGAIVHDDTSIAAKFIDLDSEKKSLNICSETYMSSNSPLVLALKRGNFEIAKKLILAGADVNIPGFRRFTPLHWACIMRANDIIQLLLEHGANPQVKNAFGRLPLEYYIADISFDELQFSPSIALIRGRDISMDDIDYNSHGVVFSFGTGHREFMKHCFATKVPDYSDLYWHLGGFLKNQGFEDLLVSTTPTFREEEQFNIYADIFVGVRATKPVLPAIIGVLNESADEDTLTGLKKLSVFAEKSSKSAAEDGKKSSAEIPPKTQGFIPK